MLGDIAALEADEVRPADVLFGAGVVHARRAHEDGREVTVHDQRLDLLLDSGAGDDVLMNSSQAARPRTVAASGTSGLGRMWKVQSAVNDAAAREASPSLSASYRLRRVVSLSMSRLSRPWTVAQDVGHQRGQVG